jgi:hypothetical protein
MYYHKIHNRLALLEGAAKIATEVDPNIESDAAAFVQRVSELAIRIRLNPNFTESISIGTMMPADYVSADAFTAAIRRTFRYA